MTMLPIAPLMIEHRLIEKMIGLMARETERIRSNIAFSPEFAFVEFRFIDAAVDFIRTYADEVHHGKEEDILFAALESKPLAPEHLATMQQLVQDHAWGRQTTARLVTAQKKYFQGETAALNDLLENLTVLVEFYPRHIAVEDQDFFLPAMAYFSQAEKDAMLARMSDFDRTAIHRRYEKVVADWSARGCKCHL
jgi:hemerythrin-like domain-containing protein